MVSPILTIGPYGHFGTFLVREANGYRSREQVVLASGQGKLLDGTVLGRVSAGAKTVAGVSGPGNVGAATINATPTSVAGAASGAWRIHAVAQDVLDIYNPAGVYVGTVAAGAPYSGDITFTVALNGGHAAPGDRYTVNVSYAVGSGKYKAYNGTGTDGAGVASAILLGNYDTTLEQDVAVVVRQAEVQRAMLVFVDESAGVPATSPHKDAAYANLALSGFAFR